jgi:serine/threonine protein kinase
VSVKVERGNELTPGTVLGGTYEIAAQLGEGAMGSVYEAKDLVLGRRVAVKVSRRYGDQLRNEARALAAVRHPGLVTVHAFGHDGPRAFMVMERVFGRTLQARLDEEPAAQRAIAEVLDVGIGVADALSAAHRAGISHRDLKPDNVLLCGERVVIVDFGLMVPELAVTGPAELAGSAEYMAPEVILRSVERGNGPLVDLYALGILLFEMLLGRTPFVAESIDDILQKHLTEEAPKVRAERPDVPAALASLVDELLAKNPSDRPASSESVLWQLRDIQRRADGRAMNVVIVDDDPGVLNSLARALRSTFPRIHVTTTDKPAQALEQIGLDPPQVVLVDLNMPHVNGLELVMALMALPVATRPQIVAMSSEADEDDLAVLRSLGVHHFVPIPACEA